MIALFVLVALEVALPLVLGVLFVGVYISELAQPPRMTDSLAPLGLFFGVPLLALALSLAIPTALLLTRARWSRILFTVVSVGLVAAVAGAVFTIFGMTTVTSAGQLDLNGLAATIGTVGLPCALLILNIVLLWVRPSRAFFATMPTAPVITTWPTPPIGAEPSPTLVRSPVVAEEPR